MSFDEVVNELKQILDEKMLCDRCTGRVFAQLLTGTNNKERGKAVKLYIAMQLDAEEKEIKGCSYSDINFRKVQKTCDQKSCWLCNDIFLQIDEIANRIKRLIEGYEFKSFLIGVVPKTEMILKEEELWERVGAEYAEPIKEELSREIGKKLLELMPDKEVDFKKADITIIVDLQKNTIKKSVRSLYIYGRYNKYAEMPQTTWLCPYCKGVGCEKCNFTGKLYEESVQDLIAEIVLKHTKGVATKFHGAGREDIDALCHGWREFVIEVEEPKIRSIDLSKIEKEINEKHKGKIEVKELKLVDKAKVKELKSKKQNKIYIAEVECSSEVEDWKILEKEFSHKTIAQQTPTRVKHRRADLVRERKVFYVKIVNADKNKATVEIKTESGTYIKELVSGDKGRTRPSFSSILGNECVVKKLIVKGFEDEATS